MKKTIVKVETLSHRYNLQWAIKDINFEIDQKGILGLLGSNGAGKSTTMNIICGVLNQTKGNVFIDGINTKENPVEARKNIGFLPQKPPLYGDLNVDEYLTYSAKLRLMDKSQIKRAVEEVKEKCGISHFSRRLIRNLSGGYQQRLGIAQAIIHNPKFVVLDEPTNGLDPNQILEVRHLIGNIAKEHAVLLSTHILSEVHAICDQILMIENGSLIFSGTINDFDNYLQPNTFVVSFLHTPSIDELESIPGIIQVESISDFESRFRVSFDGDPDITARVVEKSVHKGWILNEITLEKTSMDEIFAELSNKAKKP